MTFSLTLKTTSDLDDLSFCSISVPNFMSLDPGKVLIYGFLIKFMNWKWRKMSIFFPFDPLMTSYWHEILCVGHFVQRLLSKNTKSTFPKKILTLFERACKTSHMREAVSPDIFKGIVLDISFKATLLLLFAYTMKLHIFHSDSATYINVCFSTHRCGSHIF